MPTVKLVFKEELSAGVEVALMTLDGTGLSGSEITGEFNTFQSAEFSGCTLAGVDPTAAPASMPWWNVWFGPLMASMIYTYLTREGVDGTKIRVITITQP